jgi:hypothetical protein
MGGGEYLFYMEEVFSSAYVIPLMVPSVNNVLLTEEVSLNDL